MLLWNGLPIVLLLLAASRHASGFMQINGGRATKTVTLLQAKTSGDDKKSKSCTATATATIEKSDEIVDDSDDTKAVTLLQAQTSGVDKKSKSSTATATATIEKSDEIVDDSDNDFDSILQSRRTINSFVPILPNDWEQTLEKAIQSAIYAPNHKRTEPWRFHLLGPETIRKVCELNASIVAEKKGAKAGQAKLERWLEMPGWLVVTCKTDDGSGMDDPSGIEREDYAAVCCAVQNLCLSLHNAGLGTKWTTGPVNFSPKFGEIVGLEEEEYVVGTIWFGTPEKAPDAPAKKKSIEDVFIKTS